MDIYHIFTIQYWDKVRDRWWLLAISSAMLAVKCLLTATSDPTPKRFTIWLGVLIIYLDLLSGCGQRTSIILLQ